MENVVSQLKENAQVIYRKSIDADAQLNQFQNDGKGKFKTIFSDTAGFSVRSKRFKPYVDELMQDIAALEQLEPVKLQEKLPPIVKKMEQFFLTLSQFQDSLRE